MSTTKELTVVERARKALATVATEKALKDLATRYADLTVVKDKPDLSLAMSALGELRNTRVEIQKAGKAARDDANAFCKAVIAEEKRLIGIIAPEESRIKKLREDYEAEIERQRAEKARIEAERVAGIRARIAQFHDTVTAAANGPAERLQEIIERLDAVTIGDEYQELAGEAMVAVAQARKRARELHAEAVARKAREAAEAEARRKEAEELARQRAEQTRIEAELRAQREALEKERREAEAKARAEQQERERQAAAERAEIECQRRELAERQAEIERQERAKAEAERAEQEKAESKSRAKRIKSQSKPATFEQELEAWMARHQVSEEAGAELLSILERHGLRQALE